MGCKSGSEKKDGEISKEEQQRELAAAKNMKFTGAFPPRLETNGVPPKAHRADGKLKLYDAIKTKQGIVLVHSSTRNVLECLFYYPEYSEVKPGVPPTDSVKPAKKPTGLNKVLQDVQKDLGKFLGIKIPNPFESDDDRPPPPDAPKDPFDPKWECVRCQMKEFDTLDDVPKRWYEDATAIPGVMKLECAGPSGAWVDLSPHRYQQRWIHPNSSRMNSFLDLELSFPMRLYRLHTLNPDALSGLRELVESLNKALDSDGSKMLKELIDDEVPEAGAELDKLEERFKKLDVDAILKGIEDQMTEQLMGSYQSVRQIKCEKGSALYKFVDYLAFFEDAMLYNWFEVDLDAQMEICTHFYVKDSSSREVVNADDRGIGDRLLNAMLNKAVDESDDSYNHLKEDVRKGVTKIMNIAFSGTDSDEELTEEAKKYCDLLFPDLEDIITDDLETIDIEIIGLKEKVGEPFSGTTDELQQQLQKWREEDDQPLSDRRNALYKETVNEYETIAAKMAELNDGEEKAKILHDYSRRSRIPRIIPRHFRHYTFFFVFPLYDEENKENIKKPKEAWLQLWPENHPTLREKTKMAEMVLPEGLKDDDDNDAVEAAVGLVDSGDDTIDDDDDPRKKWVDYPNKFWRGFQVDVEVALDLNYSFNFVCDGYTFIDHNSFYSKEENDEKMFYRRIRFEAKARPFSVNPLEKLGLVA